MPSGVQGGAVLLMGWCCLARKPIYQWHANVNLLLESPPLDCCTFTLYSKVWMLEDALHATRAAVEEGILAGGGVAFIRARQSLKDMKGANSDQDAGIKIVMRALEEPLRQIVANAGAE